MKIEDDDVSKIYIEANNKDEKWSVFPDTNLLKCHPAGKKKFHAYRVDFGVTFRKK